MALESFSPVGLVAIRYILSGSVLLAGAWIARMHLPSGRELLLTAFFGLLILGGGNGSLVFAEQWIPSGVAALFITTSPFWMVGVEALLPGGSPLHLPVMGGMLVGLAGTLLLIARDAPGRHAGGAMLQGFMLLQLGCAAWAAGSIAQRRQPTRAHPVVSGAVQQLATGLLYALAALAMGTKAVHWTGRGITALLYLVIFGSIVGYSAYVYALDQLPVSIVSIYTYVNPVIAVLLGWLFYREPIGFREIAAMALIFVGIAIVKRKTPAPLPAVSPGVEPQRKSA